MFLDLGVFRKGGWAIRESTARRLVSMLEEELCTEVEFVALDPMPEMASPTFDTMISLVTLARQSFIDGTSAEKSSWPGDLSDPGGEPRSSEGAASRSS
jgi:hypothetical protein